MPTTKTKPATDTPTRAAEPTAAQQPAPDPEARPLTDDQHYEARSADYKFRAEKLKAIFSFFEDGSNLELFEYIQIINDRDRGCVTPIEDFIVGLIRHYGSAERDGRGLTLEDVEWNFDQLRDNYADAIRDSHFVASRYPRPEASDAK